MKLKELKRMLDKMSKEQLNQDLIVVANNMTYSGSGIAYKAKSNLYWDGEYDLSELKSMSELKEVYDADEIAGMVCEVRRGELIIELP